MFHSVAPDGRHTAYKVCVKDHQEYRVKRCTSNQNPLEHFAGVKLIPASGNTGIFHYIEFSGTAIAQVRNQHANDALMKLAL